MRQSVPFPKCEQQQAAYLDSLYNSALSPEFKALTDRARAKSRELNKEGISLSLSEAYLISELIRQFDRKIFIELGSLTGYSALFILRALSPGGQLFCFEKDDHCADFIESLFLHSTSVPELALKKVTVLRGDARERLRQWTTLPSGIDGVFIDANKGAYLDYLNWIEAHLQGQYLIIADNVFLGGSVWGGENSRFSKKQIQVMNEFNSKLINSSKYKSYFIESSEGLLVAKRI